MADSGAVRNTMGRRVSTPPRRGAGPLARTANVCIFSYQKTRQRVTRPHVPPAAERALQVRGERRPALALQPAEPAAVAAAGGRVGVLHLHEGENQQAAASCSDLVKMFGEVVDVKPLLSGSWD